MDLVDQPQADQPLQHPEHSAIGDIAPFITQLAGDPDRRQGGLGRSN